MTFNFYYRIGCHLCDDMYDLIVSYQADNSFEVNRINVDKDLSLQDKYGLLIPVLTDDLDNEICHYFFDKVSFEHSLKNNM